MWNRVRCLLTAIAKGLLAGLVFPVAFCVAIMLRDAWEGVAAAERMRVLRLLAPFGIGCFLTSLLVSLAMLKTSPHDEGSVAGWKTSSMGWVALSAITVAIIELVLFLPELTGKGGWLWFVLVATTGLAGWISAEHIKRSRTTCCT